jgi:hypothetical protein
MKIAKFENPFDMLIATGYKETSDFMLSIMKNDDLFVKVAFASVEQDFCRSLPYSIKDPAFEAMQQLYSKGGN